MCSFGSSGASAPTTQFTTQTTTADPRAQAMYGQAFNTAQQAANRPFTPYSYDPSAFVAPINPLQLQAMGNIAGYQGTADPYYQAAGGMAGLSGMTTAPQVVSQYMSPYMREVIDPTRRALEQQQGMQLAQQQAEAIKGGAFGGERAVLQRAALRGQQQLGLGQALAPLYQAGYGQALQGAQTDLSRQLQAAQVMGGLGTGAQTAGLQGAQALLGAGTLGQQTQQAGLQALFNQYMLQQQYPFMASQFLTQAAAGLGPGYGGTTTGQQTSFQPLSYFGNPLSDPDLKTGARDDDDEPQVIGETKDGQKIYRYRLIDPDTGELGPAQIGLMADEVEERTPEAVGDYKGYRTVDYAKATDDAARLGGGVTGRGDYAYGGRAGYQYGGADDDLSGLIASHGAMYKPLEETGSKGIVPASQVTPAKLESADLTYMTPQQKQKSSLAQNLDSALGLVKGGKEAYGLGKEALGAAGGLGSLGSMLGGAGTVGATGGVPVGVIGALGAKAVPTFGAAASAASPGFLAGLGAAAMKALPFLAAAVSDPSLKTGVRPKFQDGGGSFSPDDIDRFLGSLAKIETGGREDPYSTMGPQTKYGRPIGKYQILPTNVPEWSEQAGLGRLTPEQFVGNKEAQEAVARAKFGEYLNKTGSGEEAAAMWFGGPGYKKHAGAKDVLGTSIPEYQAKFRRGLGEADAGPLAYAATEKPGLGGALDAVSRIGGGTLRSDATETPAETPSAGLAPTRLAAAPEGLTGLLRGTAPEGMGERAADFLTSEKFIVPLLAGLGTMASSGSRFLGPAVLQGIGGGAKAYAELAQQQFEREKMAEELGLKKRGVGVEELKAGIDLRKLLQEQQSAKNIADIMAGRTPTVTQPSVSPAETAVKPETAPAKPELPPVAGAAPVGGQAKSDAMRNADAAEAKADEIDRLIQSTTDPRTQMALIQRAQEERARADKLRAESPEYKRQTAYETETAKTLAKKLEVDQEAAERAETNISNINRASELLETPYFRTGFLGEYSKEGLRALESFPERMRPDWAKGAAAAAQEFDALAGQMLLDTSGGSLGAGISNEDRRVIGKTKPSLENSYETNKQILARMKRLEQRKQEIADFQNKWIERNGPLNDRYFADLKKWAKENPMFSEQERKSAGVPASEQPSTLPPKEELEKGKVYNIGGRKGRWSGTGFVEVK